MAASTGLSTYREGSLHAALKALYARPGDRVEEGVDGRGKRLAMRATYCLQRAGATRSTGRRG
jgi:hypothetical protein